MTMLKFHPEAKVEADAAAKEYWNCNPAVGNRFDRLVNEAFDQIKAYPHRWASYLYGTTIYRIDGFPYAVVYLQQSPLVVVAVAHLHRDPGYWKIRLTNE